LGELTASVAHEVNQPLAGGLANAEACLRWLDAQLPTWTQCAARWNGLSTTARAAPRSHSRNGGVQLFSPPRKLDFLAQVKKAGLFAVLSFASALAGVSRWLLPVSAQVVA
jgi:hypothetical protein